MSNHWTAEENRNYRGRNLSGWIIRYDPTPDGKKNADGSTSYSINFPALVLTDVVSEPEKQANNIATVLESHDELVAAATDYARITMVENFPREDIAVGAAYERLRAAIAKATGSA